MQMFFSSPKVQTGCGAHTAVCYTSTGGPFPAREAHYCEVRNEWSSTSTPPVCLHGAHNSNAACPFPTLQDNELQQWSGLTSRVMPRVYR
jgi:hypothetical protein